MERYYAVHNTPIFLGYVGEEGAREIAFDVSGWKERDGVIQLMARRPEEDVMYPVHLTEDGNYVVWTVGSGDVARAGQSGLCELSLADEEGTVLKSGTWVTYVYTAMGGGAGSPAAPEQGWLDRWRTEVAEVEALTRKAEECAAYVSAALGQEGYDPDWLEGWQAAAEQTRASALEAGMAASRAAVRAARAEESAAAAARMLEQMRALSGNSEALSLIRTILGKAVYTENVSGLLAQMDDLLAGSGEEITLTSLSATYTGGSVPVGTAVTALTGVMVTASYSDGTAGTVVGYTLSGTIREGSNTITVSYGGRTASFTVTGYVPSAALTGITVSYSGGNVPAGTPVDELTGITVTGHYSDGSAATLTSYSVVGIYTDSTWVKTISEGENTVTVQVKNFADTVTVVGVAESGGDGDDTEVTLVSISAAYTGGSVPVGTAAAALTGVTVEATYSDGSTATVTDYTLSGSIAEGSNTITVSYGGKTTSFTVTGEAEDSGSEENTGDGHVVITDSGVSATDDGDGNVTVTGMTATDDGNGNITVS